MSIAANNTCRQAVSWALALSLGWLTACAPQPGAVPPLQKPNTSAPANASAALLRQQHPQHPNPNHPSNRRALQQRQLLPAYFIELNAEYQGFSTLALTASYLERKVRTLITNNDGEALRREIDFARYKHPQLLINIMLADPSLYTAAAAMPEVVAFRSVSAPFDAYMQQLAGENTDVQEFRVNTSLGYHGSKSVAMNESQSVVVWDAIHLGSQQHIYAQRYDSQGLPDGPEFQISQADNNPWLGWRSNAVAMDSSGDFVATWSSYGSNWSERHVYARRYDSQGQALGPEFQVNTEAVEFQGYSAIAMDDTGNFVIAWLTYNGDWSERHVYARRYDSQGQALGPEFQVSEPDSDASAWEPNLAMDTDGNFWVSWMHGIWSESDILMRRYDANGVAQGAAFQVNSLPEKNILRYPMVAVDGQGNLVVAWTSYADDEYDAEVFARRYTSNGTPQEAEFQVNSHAEGVQTTVAVVMAADGDFVMTWTGYDEDWYNPQIYARRYGSNGTAKDPDFRVNTSTAYYHAYPMLAMDNEGNFNIAWTRYEAGWSGLPSDIYAMRYNASGQPQPAPQLLPEHDVTPEFRVNTHSTGKQLRPDIAMDSAGNFVMVWQSQAQDGDEYGVYAQRYQANGTPQGAEFQVNTYTTHNQHRPAVAMSPEGNFVVVWLSTGQDAAAEGIYFQRYNAQGIPQGSETQISSHPWWVGHIAPDVAMAADGSFVVTWGKHQHGEDVYARRYDAQGQAQGEEFPVNTYTTHNQNAPALAMSPEGNFVITWTSLEQDGDSAGVYAQRYNAQGQAQGEEFRVNTYTTDAQSISAIAMSSDGHFAITWTSVQDGDSTGIYAQRYDAQGQAQGEEFQVNTETVGFQGYSAIAMSATGHFMITWGSGSGISGHNIRAQHYNAQGQPQDGEFQANLFRWGLRGLPAIAMSDLGNHVITWESAENIWARVFDSQGQPK